MPAGPDDWRRTGQERDLPPGTVLRLTRYHAHSPTSEHEHCLFCWAKFMDPDFSAEHRTFIADHPEVLTTGYTTADQRHWLCPPCAADFADELQLHLVEG
jgi:hypothetical protein